MRSAGTIAFLFLAGVEAILLAALCILHRMPIGHDGFNYFLLQYYFLNNAAQVGEIPHWLPYLFNGTVATWWYIPQASFLQQVFLQTAFLFRQADLLQPFYLGLGVDTGMLLTGTWLLARRFFRSNAAVFLVSSMVLGSTLWASQPWFNFHLFSAVPLLLVLLHRFLDRGRWRYLLLAGNLFAAQSLGGLPYTLPALGLVMGAYCLFYALCHRAEVTGQLRRLRWVGSDWIWLCAMLACWAALASLAFGMTDTVHYVYGRSADGRVPLEVFLRYGGSQKPVKWLELLLGIAPGLDYSLYVGMAGIALAVWGIVCARRDHFHFVLLLPFVLALSMGTALARAAYHFWPMMQYYRHLGYLDCFVKLSLCFLAGAGLEALRNPDRQRVPPRLLLWLGTVPLTLAGLLLFHLARRPEEASALVTAIFADDVKALFTGAAAADFLSDQLPVAGRLALLSGLGLAAAALSRRRTLRTTLLRLLILLEFVDLYGVKVTDALSKTTALSATERVLTHQQPIPFRRQRVALLKDEAPRTSIVLQLPFFGALPASIQLFLFLDEPGSSVRVDYVQRPVDLFLRTYWGLPLTGGHETMTHWMKHRKAMNMHPAALKMVGMTEDKIQFFTGAAWVRNEADVAQWIRRPDYTGDCPLLLPRDGVSPQPALELRGGVIRPDLNLRARIPYRVERFDSNRLEISLPEPPSASLWMLYSDAWHEAWAATADEQAVPIFRANLAYKAVPLAAGTRAVRFSFRLPALGWAQRLLALNALLWIVGLVWMAAGIIRGGTGEVQAGKG